MMRNMLRWFLLLLLCGICACSREDPVPVEPVLQDGVCNGVADIVVNGKIAGQKAAEYAH